MESLYQLERCMGDICIVTKGTSWISLLGGLSVWAMSRLAWSASQSIVAFVANTLAWAAGSRPNPGEAFDLLFRFYRVLSESLTQMIQVVMKF